MQSGTQNNLGIDIGRKYFFLNRRDQRNRTGMMNRVSAEKSHGKQGVPRGAIPAAARRPDQVKGK